MLRHLRKPNHTPEKEHEATDEALMEALCRGRQSAAGVLFDRYHVALYNYFLRMSEDREWSHDLTQTTFERLLRYCNTYQTGKPLRSWLYQIARNALYDHFGKPQNRYSDFTETDDMPSPQKDGWQQLHQSEQRQHLHRALQQLKPELREVLVLTRFRGMRYQEAAQILDCSEGALKVRVHRAIKELRRHYFILENPTS